MIVHEDNSSCITAIRAGYSPALRYLNRTARISLGFLNEVLCGSDKGESESNFGLLPKLQHCPTDRMKADIFTKPLDRVRYLRALDLLGVRGVSSEGGVKLSGSELPILHSRSPSLAPASFPSRASPSSP